MNDFIAKMLSPDSDVSTVRVMALVSLLVGCVIAFIGLFKGVDLMGLSALAGVFVGSAFAGKIVQKSQELKNGE